MFHRRSFLKSLAALLGLGTIPVTRMSRASSLPREKILEALDTPVDAGTVDITTDDHHVLASFPVSELYGFIKGEGTVHVAGYATSGTWRPSEAHCIMLDDPIPFKLTCPQRVAVGGVFHLTIDSMA